ncbi:MAG: VanZ family protein [Gammaproteobacteria bacterium]
MEKLRDPGILISYCALIFYLSAQPNVPLDDLFSVDDKIMHLLAYAGMGWLAWRAFGHFVPTRSRLAVCCLVFCTLYGLSDEIHQFYVPGRTADLYDWIADIVGAAISIWFMLHVEPAAYWLPRSLASPLSGKKEE